MPVLLPLKRDGGVVPDVQVPASDALTTAQRLLRDKLAR